MNRKQYKVVLKAYTAVKVSEETQSKSAGGRHYDLAFAMKEAGIDIGGLSNSELMGEAERVLINYVDGYREARYGVFFPKRR